MSRAVDALLRDPRIWRGRASPTLSDQRTGFAELDRLLPGRGWPRAALVELLNREPGCGELSLLLPSLRQQAQCWIAPPWIPYAPALAAAGIDLQQLLVIQPDKPRDGLWALEQVLRSGVYSQVLGWQATADMRDLRRLQLAAEQGGCRLFLFRPARCRHQASPASLRLYLEPAERGLYLRILKSRGGQPAALIIDPADALALHSSATTATGRPASRAA